MGQSQIENDNHSFRPIIGIDLGTTNSAAAYIYKGKPKMIPMTNEAHTIPSVVLMAQSGDVTVGEDARSALVAMADRTKAAVKREMGKDISIPLGDYTYSPEEVSAFILKEIKKAADQHLGEGEKEAVITVPAYFNNQQRQATKTAGELAGFVVERIINEPTAASLAFGMQHLDEESHILVYDLGGGTFDVSVVEMMEGILEVKASTGNSNLGGEDFDWLIVDWLAEKVVDEYQIDPREDLRAQNRLKEEAEDIKKKLSFQEYIDISIPVVTVKENTPIGLDTALTQNEFAELIKPLIQETTEKLSQVLDDADLKMEEIDEVLLVGGSTRIPHVQQEVEAFFGRAPKDEVDPDKAVALGAGVQAGLKSGALAESGLIVTDVAPFSMGIAVLDQTRFKSGAFHSIITRNTTIPVTRTEQFATTVDNQTSVNVEIYQGENDWVRNNHFLNEFVLEGLPEEQAGREAVDVTFRYNLNGILEVSAKSASTGKTIAVTLEDAIDRSSEEAFQDSLAKVEAAFEEDTEFSDLETENETLHHLTNEANEWHSRLSGETENTSGDDRENLKKHIKQLEEALETNDPAALEKSVEDAIDLAIDLEL